MVFAVPRFQYITPMAKRFFLLFDTDGNGELDFTEFVMCTWNYLTLDDICLIDLGNALGQCFDALELSQLAIIAVQLAHPFFSLPEHCQPKHENNRHNDALKLPALLDRPGVAFQMYDDDGTGSLDSFDVANILMEVRLGK